MPSCCELADILELQVRHLIAIIISMDDIDVPFRFACESCAFVGNISLSLANLLRPSHELLTATNSLPLKKGISK